MERSTLKRMLVSPVLAAVAAASTLAMADSSSSETKPERSCAIGYVTGIGGSAQSFREYLASANPYRYLAENPIQCQVSLEGRASDCVGVVSLRNERVSVYDDSDPTTMSVVARVELDRGTYPVIINVRKQDVKCEDDN
jgi:hypothetical protein